MFILLLKHLNHIVFLNIKFFICSCIIFSDGGIYYFAQICIDTAFPTKFQCTVP